MGKTPAVQAVTGRVPIVSGKMCGSDGVLMENLYFIFTFEPLHNTYLEVFRPFKSYLIQCLSSDENLASVLKAKMLSLVRLSLIKACSGTLALIKEKYPILDFHVFFAREKKMAQLNGLFRGERL